MLTLDDRVAGRDRRISLRRSGEDLRLVDGEQTTTWRIVSTRHRPSDDARADAGEIVFREEVPLEWAVSFDRRSVGEFWAFFPTEFRTTLSGILNAPWKTNSDRQNLLRGEFNDEVLEAAATLVVESLPDLVRDEDPGRVLELLPGRGRESRNWADELLGDRIADLARRRPTLPDQSGRLEYPAALRMHPDVAAEAVIEWSKYPGRPMNWVHSSVLNRDRRARVERLIDSESVAGIGEWVEALAADMTAEASASAIRVAARLIDSGTLTASQRLELDRARFVLAVSGRILPPNPAIVFTDGNSSDGYEIVDPAVLTAPGLRGDLALLGVGHIDPEGQVRSMLQQTLSRSMDWDALWKATRVLGPERAAEVLSESRVKIRQLRVKSVSGEFLRVNELLLPGAIADPQRDPSATVDLAYHAEDLSALDAIGVAAAPKVGGGSSDEPWFSTYREAALARYEEELKDQRGLNPSRELLEFEEAAFIGPLEVYSRLSELSKAEFCRVLLSQPGELKTWYFTHSTRPGSYPRITFPSPALWLLRSDGRLPTSTGVRKTAEAVGPQLDRYSRVLPVAGVTPEAARRLRLPTELEEIRPNRWKRILGLAADLDPDAIGSLYALAAPLASVPAKLACVVGDAIASRPHQEIVAVGDPAIFQLLRDACEPAILVPDDGLDQLLESWHLRTDGGQHGVRIDADPVAPPTALLDEFRPLRHLLSPDAKKLSVVRCDAILRVTTTPQGSTSTELTGVVQGDVIYWHADEGDRQLLEFIDRELSLGLMADDIDAVLTGAAEDAVHRRLNEIRAQETTIDRILSVVTPEALRRHLPAGLVEAVESERGSDLSAQEVVELVESLHGVGLLRELAPELAAAGLEPPRTWNGGPAARQWVQQLGFAVEYAGSEAPRRDPLLRVEGPPRLHPLHGFQRAIADKIQQVIRASGGSRGLVSLPTGAGKTRTAVQSLVELATEGALDGVVLWVAQNDELCEQAVQAWAEVWRGAGPSRPLSISRLWSSNEAESTGGLQVVVATISKLAAIQDSTDRTERYDWLSSPACVVIDEAHGSTTPEYTRLLEWLKLDRNKRTRPMIGLTATPFRGTSESETTRLINRYDGVRLDEGAFEGDPYEALQQMGVLARVRHQVLDGGLIELSESELDQLNLTRRLPKAVEERIAADEDRNRVLLDSLTDLPVDWTALVFAASVSHAQSLAARLTLAGIPAAPVWGGTPAGIRRNHVERFRRGELRVLTNYSVFAEGFDAPAVRAVYVARPTFSPNRYQQMIGRGLRGPLNGGKEECLIVDMSDNVERYGGELAFRDYEPLWRGSGGSA